jgi:glycerol-3-phosphate acyltransferase PlsX
MKIIVDAMGGDNAPEVIVKGAIEAVNEYDVQVILVGEKWRIDSLLAKIGYPEQRISVCAASEVINMEESPAVSVRKKRNSSIVVGMNLLKSGEGEAFFSAGNTGAVVCAATLFLGLLPGIERPGIAIIYPTLKGTSFVIDAGANIGPKPAHLLQYAFMADAYFRCILNKPQPRIGLLNIGEEQSKGTEFMKEVHELLSKSGLGFIGNVEAKHLFSGECDIVICDGFVGNIVLKVSESVAETLYGFLRQHIRSSFLNMLAIGLLKKGIRRFKNRLDYSEYGGALLLGVNGVVIIGHGRSNVKAVKNAIRLAKEEVERKVNERIVEAIKTQKN